MADLNFIKFLVIRLTNLSVLYIMADLIYMLLSGLLFSCFSSSL